MLRAVICKGRAALARLPRGWAKPFIVIALATTSCFSPPRDDFPDDPASSRTAISTSAASDSSAGSGGASGEGGDVTSGGGLPCGEADDGVCVPAPPAGWRAVAILESIDGEPPSCALTSYPDEYATYVGEIDEGSAACECECEPPTGVACTDPTTVCYDDELNECNEACSGQTQLFLPETCTFLESEGLQWAGVRPPAPTSAGSCDPIFIADIDEPTWDIELVACSGERPLGECEQDFACIAPTGDESAALCIVRGGDVDCPDGVFSAKRVRYSEVSDERDCTCSCGTPDISCGYVDFTADACGEQHTVEVHPDACGDLLPGGAFDGRYGYYYPTPSGSCAPSAGEIDGEVERGGETTICCIP